ncbi:SAM-dependent methyltransferase [bacterium endosymbiont of Pedicinus badii]|uniref:SAM-dependent methyltransferase n=1 Tax=bacterium endosymbiont of Pedicinus badii TaxID=1719126 RepID=UPI001FB24AE3|nr:SAM-dependent methyltransferase [bacterium endosymbiont of Pedicinus badii]
MNSSKYKKKTQSSLYIVATPIGNLSDITKRAIQVLQKVEIIAAENILKTINLLNKLRIKKKLYSLNKNNEKKKLNFLFLKFKMVNQLL